MSIVMCVCSNAFQYSNNCLQFGNLEIPSAFLPSIFKLLMHPEFPFLKFSVLRIEHGRQVLYYWIVFPSLLFFCVGDIVSLSCLVWSWTSCVTLNLESSCFSFSGCWYYRDMYPSSRFKVYFWRYMWGTHFCLCHITGLPIVFICHLFEIALHLQLTCVFLCA